MENPSKEKHRGSQRLSQKRKNCVIFKNTCKLEKTKKRQRSSQMHLEAIEESSNNTINSVDILDGLNSETFSEQFPLNQVGLRTSSEKSALKRNSLKRKCTSHLEGSSSTYDVTKKSICLEDKETLQAKAYNVKTTNLTNEFKEKSSIQTTDWPGNGLPDEMSTVNENSGSKNTLEKKENSTTNKELNVDGIILRNSSEALVKRRGRRGRKSLSTKENSPSTNTFYTMMQQPIHKVQYFQHDSLLPSIYPSHFVNQLEPKENVSSTLNSQCADTVPKKVLQSHINQSDDEISPEYIEASSPTSSLSLSESLCEIFHTDDMREVLKIPKVLYRLNEYHVQALALVLNLNVEYLHKMLEKTSTLSSEILKKIESASKNL